MGTTRLDAPPQAAKIRELVEERLAEAQREGGEKITVEWRGQNKHLYVISMPADVLYYNPQTHRIRAQRSLDPIRDRALDADPWGEEGQLYLGTLLKSQPSDPDKTDPDFTALCEDLESFGQKDPGLITQGGILVNGNTRCAALRHLGEKNIRVGVLPETATWDDINTVELSLQLRKEYKRDYSYINRLLAIDEQLASGRRHEDVAKAFRIKRITLDQDVWVYGLIQELIERSGDADGSSLRLVDFERHQESFKELARDYFTLLKTDPDAAAQLKESRSAMIVLDYAKTDVRLAKANFHETYLNPRLADEIRPAARNSAPVAIPGLQATVSGPAPAAAAAKELTDTLLKAKATVVGAGRTSVSAAKQEQAAGKIKAARDAFDRALEPAGKDARLQQRKAAAPDRLFDACDDIDLCVAELAQARATRGLDEDAFDDAALRLRGSLAKLAKEAKRTFNEPGDGTAWLLALGQDAAL